MARQKGTRNIIRHPKMPDFAVVLTEGTTKAGGLVDKLELIDLLADQKCSCGGNCSCKKESDAPKCLCVGYAGQNFLCPEHIGKTECPKCKSLDVEHEIHSTVEFAEYNCTICGFFYARRLSDGEYQYM